MPMAKARAGLMPKARAQPEERAKAAQRPIIGRVGGQFGSSTRTEPV